MSNPDTERPEISTETVTALDTLLRQYRAQPPSAQGSTDYRTLLLYLRGELAQEEARVLERSLLNSSPGRRRLREGRSAAAEFASLPWSEIQRRAAEGDALAQAWSALTLERAGMLSQAWHSVRQRLQEDMRLLADELTGEARSLWSVLRAFAIQWKRERQWEASLPALARGGDAPDAAGLNARLSAHVDAEGALQAVLIAGAPPEQADTAGEPEFELFLHNSLGEIPLGIRRMENGRAEWRIAGFARLLGLPGGRISAALFRIAPAGAHAVARDTPQEHYLVAEVMNAEGRPRSGEGVPLRLTGPPRVEGELLALDIAIDAPTRRAYRGYWVALDYLLWEDRPIALGAWPVDEWQAAPRQLRIQFPAAGEFVPGQYLPLRVRLTPRNPVKLNSTDVLSPHTP